MSTQTAEQGRPEVIRNGVNVSELAETIRAIESTPELAKFKFRAKNKWLTGGHNQVRVQSYYGTSQELTRDKAFEFDADEPPVLLGKDQGANPVEYLLTALSGCMTTTLAYHAAANGIDIEAIESEYEGDIDLHGFLDLDPNVRKGYQEVRVKFKVKTNADKETLEELVKKSPVFDIVTNPTPVKLMIETV